MSEPLPKTLLQMAGADLTPASPEKATLLLIDLQNEYRHHALPLHGIEEAIAAAAKLLARARAAGSPVVHVVHRGRPGGMFDLAQPRGAIVDELAPVAGEAIIEKPLPNAFAGTLLANALVAAGRKDILIAGAMTHNCVSSTARAAIDYGWRVTLAARACATRDLPDGLGGLIPAPLLHRISLAALADRIAIVEHEAP